MRRRDFITGVGCAAALSPVLARGQPQPKPIIGVFGPAPINVDKRRMQYLMDGLAENGYYENQNVTVSTVHADGRYDRLAALATDLVDRRVDLIVVPNSTVAALAAKSATKDIPIVFSAGTDPIKEGLVASVARPGGNLTGTYSFSTELGAKRLGLLRELVPAARSIIVLANPANTATELGARNVEAAARIVGLQVRVLRASNIDEIGVAFATLEKERGDALIVINDPFFTSRRTQIVSLAAKYAVPAIYSNREYAEIGGLLCYTTSITEIYHQLGAYAGRILRGASPANLPVVQSTKFELIINMKAAKVLGLVISPTLLAHADEVIE